MLFDTLAFRASKRIEACQSRELESISSKRSDQLLACASSERASSATLADKIGDPAIDWQMELDFEAFQQIFEQEMLL